jgi:HEAT repeat protein
MPLFGPLNVEKLGARRDIAGLAKALAYKKDWKVRTAAARALGDIGDARAVEPLIAALKDKDSHVREATVRALGKIGDARAVKALSAALKGGDWLVRKAAAEALGKIGDARAVKPLIAALKDEVSDVREAAAGALCEIGDARAVEPLIAALKDGNFYVRQAAAGALGAIGAPAVKPLIAALKDKDSDVRKAAAGALGKIGWKPEKGEAEALYLIAQGKWDECVKIGAPAVEPLIAALKDGDSDVRQAAAGALGAIGAPAVKPLIAALKDGHKWVRKAAAGALGKIGWKPEKGEAEALYLIAQGKWDECVKIGAPAVEPLIAALKDGDSDVREAAAGALGKIGWKPEKGEAEALYLIAQGKWDECVKIGAPAVEPLIAALKDGDSGVREAVAKALGAIGDARAVEPLIAALKDGEPGVRKAAAEALVKIYREGRLGAAQRQLIFAQRDAISKPHHDSGDRCAVHGDEGIGVPFPL